MEFINLPMNYIFGTLEADNNNSVFCGNKKNPHSYADSSYNLASNLYFREMSYLSLFRKVKYCPDFSVSEKIKMFRKGYFDILGNNDLF